MNEFREIDEDIRDGKDCSVVWVKYFDDKEFGVRANDKRLQFYL